jgi:ubiquinone/menaquinone biosynthesis C-methylase UbiE
MTMSDTRFAGSIPGLYDRLLGPLLFIPYAQEVARRVSATGAGKVLETAAGTGLVTEAVQRAMPDADIVATDLNPDMLAVAADRISSPRVSFQQADAMALPFADAGFDLVICQFGVMFYPDRVRANAEARRVLRDGGTYLIVVWDALDRNSASRIVSDALAELFPANPPNFLARTPFGYSDPDLIRSDLREAGFAGVELETIALASLPTTAVDAATGLVAGSPLRNEVEAFGPQSLDEAIRAATAALARQEVDGQLRSTLSAHIVTAVK